jgi:hypothetical protein
MNERTQRRKSLRCSTLACALLALAAGCSDDESGVTFANCPSTVNTGITTGAVSQAPSLQQGAGGSRTVERPGPIRIFQQVPAVFDGGMPLPTTTGMGPDTNNPCLVSPPPTF